MRIITIVCFLLFVSLGLQAQMIPSGFQGSWHEDCEQNGIIFIGKTNPIEMIINYNQINISAKGVISASDANTLSLYYIKPADLGPGGIGLSWNNFSKQKPIGQLRLSAKIPGKIKFIWFGFYNVKRGKYEWVEDLDISTPKLNEFNLIKCD